MTLLLDSVDAYAITSKPAYLNVHAQTYTREFTYAYAITSKTAYINVHAQTYTREFTYAYAHIKDSMHQRG